MRSPLKNALAPDALSPDGKDDTLKRTVGEERKRAREGESESVSMAAGFTQHERLITKEQGTVSYACVIQESRAATRNRRE